MSKTGPLPPLNYFTCTLSEAAQWKETAGKGCSEFDTVLGLIDEQARLIPHCPALGIPCLRDESASIKLTFAQLRAVSYSSVRVLRDALKSKGQDESPKVIGLLSVSNLSFLATFLGLMRLGHTVLLLAPQLDTAAIEHLRAASNMQALFADETQLGKVVELKQKQQHLGVFPCPPPPQLPTITNLADDLLGLGPPNPRGADDIPYLMHTSGTSSGLPKPIIQTHWGAVGVLPRLNLSPSPSPPTAAAAATFTTTPLYHGGLADCLRAWASGAPVWLFPEGTAPITADTVVASVLIARSYHHRRQHHHHHHHHHQSDHHEGNEEEEEEEEPDMYFSSVPYVLQLLHSSSSSGIPTLRSMALVGVGGAALPDAVGDSLARDHGVRLVSRLGSAECGFLLCSAAGRDFATDFGWQYLRVPDASEGGKEKGMLVFEPQRGGEEEEEEKREGEERKGGAGTTTAAAAATGLSEMIVGPNWPLRLKTNRADGSYATADLFAPHPDSARFPGAWRYHGRADSQVVLITGKKFDPAPVEGAIVAACAAATAAAAEDAEKRDGAGGGGGGGQKTPLASVKDVLVFGTGKSSAGALLFFVVDDEEQMDRGIDTLYWPVIRDLNASWPRHAALSRSMLLAVPQGRWAAASAASTSNGGGGGVRVEGAAAPLEKSSKGTILRSKAEARYADLIEAAYRPHRRKATRNGHSSQQHRRSNGEAASAAGAANSEGSKQEEDRVSPIPDNGDDDDDDTRVHSALSRLFSRVLGRPDVDPSRDLFQQGVDSVACVQLRRAVQSELLLPVGDDDDGDDEGLPLNVVYDCGTVDALARYVVAARKKRRRRRQGGDGGAGGEAEEGERKGEGEGEESGREATAAAAAAQLQRMRELADKYSARVVDSIAASRRRRRAAAQRENGLNGNAVQEGVESVVLTGATGALGSHVLDRLLRQPNVRRVWCLVRARDAEAAHGRVAEALSSRKLDVAALELAGEKGRAIRVECVPFDMFADADAEVDVEGEEEEEQGPGGGIVPRAALRAIRRDATFFIHAAWSVNFTLSLASFEGQLAATTRLIGLCLGSNMAGARFCFVSSTAAVASSSSSSAVGGVPESESKDPADASGLGYSQSKWVAERICAAAYEETRRNSNKTGTSSSAAAAAACNTEMPLLSVIRAGQLCGNDAGIWNLSEAYPLMLSTADITGGCLPDIPGATLDWLPVDQAAAAVVDIALPPGPGRGGGEGRYPPRRPETVQMPVLHVVNKHQSPGWGEMLDWIVETEAKAGRQIRVVPAAEWVRLLEAALESRFPTHPSRSILGFWKQRFLNCDNEGGSMSAAAPRFDVTQAEKASEAMRRVSPLSREQVLRMWRWVMESQEAALLASNGRTWRN